MAPRTVYYVEARSGGSEGAAGVVVKQDISDNLRDIVNHFPVTNTMDDLAFLELCTKAVQSVQFALIHARPQNVAAGQVEGVREDDAEGGTERCDHVYPGQVRGGAQVIEGSQNRVSGPSRGRL
jgi:hypothetical protein